METTRAIICATGQQCKYLTYKEWKLKNRSIKNIIVMKNVSTLPIRNGNIDDIISSTGCEGLNVSTLPIRNGNDYFLFYKIIV